MILISWADEGIAGGMGKMNDPPLKAGGR